MRRVFTDTHCHLDSHVFKECLPFVLGSARAKGVERFIVPSVSRDAWGAVLALSKNIGGVTFALGLHPVFLAQHRLQHLVELERLLALSSESCVAVGEIGLDARIGELDSQHEYFSEQLSIAVRFDLPVIVHSVRSHAAVLKALKFGGNSRGVIHAFSGSYAEAKAFVDQGFYLGIGSVICRSRAGKTYEAIRKLPVDALLLETDSPDMYLPTSPSKLGSPLDIIQIYSRLCEIKELNREELSFQIECNVDSLFFS